eukprot:TRINITY_DN8232_c0_g2_i1.p1 TRINITY_DN8232_c0_g2~~TRINITY_DN8232_c0_g2_i1.p1  ORF type:complete len:445 (+),score=50.72 TRINITY_DN8232_c0_g2_i1:47-1381(+)
MAFQDPEASRVNSLFSDTEVSCSTANTVRMRSPMSGLEAGLTLLKCNWGIGMMAMPYMLKCGGLATGFSLFIASMAITQFSIVRLIQSKQKVEMGGERDALIGAEDLDGPPLDFTGLMTIVLGPKAEVASLVSIALSMWGSCIAYFMFIHDNMPKFIAFKGVTWVGFVCVPTLLLSFFDDLKFLAPSSFFGIMCAMGFAVVVFVDTADNVSLDDFDTFLSNTTQFDFEKLPLTLSIAAFCNEGIVVLSPSTHTALAFPDRFTMISGLTIIIFTCCYMAVGVAGDARYYATPDGVKDEIAKNMSITTLNKIAVVLYCVQLIPSFAVVYYCSYEALEWKWCRISGVDRGGDEWRTNYKKKALLFRFAGILLAAAVAVSVNSFGNVLGLIGALATSMAIYILPHIAWLRLNSTERPLYSQLPSYACIVYGVILAVSGTAQSLYNIFT